MDLSGGICVLCTKNTNIIVPPQAKNITALLKDVLSHQIDYKKFDKINSALKVCPICLQDLITVTVLKKNIKEEFSENHDNCALCYSEEHLLRIRDWTDFYKMLENVSSESILDYGLICLNCIKCLNLLERIKTNLFKKHPNLQNSNLAQDRKFKEPSPTTKKRHETHRKLQKSELSSENEHPSDDKSDYFPQRNTKYMNNLESALMHLKPLKNTQYDTIKFKGDKKLLKQIAFVKLSVSNLNPKDCKYLEGKPKRSDGSKRSLNLSDTDSSDAPSPKQSFFKIKLKINPNKTKSQRVTHGKVKKPKPQKTQSLLGNKKELIVKILKMNLDNIENFNQEYKNTLGIKTLTKASRKMMPEDFTSSSKKRKSVTFADVLDTDISDGIGHKDNAEATPLKSLLKKSTSPVSHFLKSSNGGSSDESDNEDDKKANETDLNQDSDQEFEVAKSFVEEILKNNDDIFDNLKSSGNTRASTELKETRNTNFDSSDSEDIEKTDNTATKNNEHERKQKNISVAKKDKRRASILVIDSEDKRTKGGNVENTSEENEKETEYEKESTERKEEKRDKNIVTNSDSDDFQKGESDNEESKFSAKNKEDDDTLVNVAKESKTCDTNNKLDDDVQAINTDSNTDTSKRHSKEDKNEDSHNSTKSKESGGKEINYKRKKKRRSNSINGTDLEENTTNNDGFSKDHSGIENRVDDILSTGNGEIVRSDVESETSLSKCIQNINNCGEVVDGSGTSVEDQEVTLEEFRKLRKSSISEATESEKIEDRDSKDTSSEDSTTKTVLSDDVEITNDHSKNFDQNVDNERDDKDEQKDRKHVSNTENSSNDSNLRRKSKKRRKSTIERQEDDEETVKSKDEECSEEPGTKKVKVSEVDGLGKAGFEHSICPSKKNNEDVSLGVPGNRKDDGTIDNKIDELIAQYTNPSSPKLNNDNISDIQNVGASSEDQGSRSEVSASKSKAVDIDINMISKKDIETSDEDVLELVEEGIESDIILNDVSEQSNVTVKGLDLDNILENIVDSC